MHWSETPSAPKKTTKVKTDIRSRVPSGSEMPTTVKVNNRGSDARIPRLVSLQDLLKEDSGETIRTEELPKESYTQEQLTEAWMEYAYSIKSSDLDFFSTLSSFLPVIKTATQVEVTVHNSTQSSDIIKMKPQLLAAVRKVIKNFDFDFEIVINKEEAKEIAVTPQEKFAKMIEKNPLLEKLKNKLELGF